MSKPVSLRLIVVAGALALAPLMSWAEGRSELANHVAPLVHSGTDLGAADQKRLITLTVSLKNQNSTAFEQRLQSLYDPSSAHYHQWLTADAATALLAPATGDLAAVRQFLSGNGFRELGSGPNHVVVRGTVADAQRAFGVSIHNYRTARGTFYANNANPSIPASLSGTVAAVSGLSEHRMQPHLMHPHSPDGAPAARVLRALVPDGVFYSAQCIRPPQTQTFTSPGVRATYRGNRYGQDATNQNVGALPPCGYQPSDWQTAYGLNTLYQHGLDGTGTTVAIVDAFGSTTIQNDLATFSGVYGLPAANLTVVGTATASPFSTDPNLAGWAEETTLDVEWVHAIAPGAKIVLFVSPDDSDVNLTATVAQAVTYPHVVVVSNSYGLPESTEDAAGFAATEAANKLGASMGISVNYSSGDFGDFALYLGYTDVSYPSSSPWATGIGGTSVVLNPNGSIAWQTGWGNNLTKIVEAVALGATVDVPPVVEGSIGGSGGGTSAVFPKPEFQSQLRGRYRQVPDISWVADPYTGAELILTADSAGDQAFTAIGGTSLSCPTFSALWAITAQRTGHRNGLAARTIYGLGQGAIQDVQAVGSNNNVTGEIRSGSTHLAESATALVQPEPGNGRFFSALYDSPFSTRWYVLSFGTDTSLTVTPGWDNVTGLGTPNGPAFVEAVARAAD